MASIQQNIVSLKELGGLPVLNQDTLAQIKMVDGGELGLTKELFEIFKADTSIRLSAIKAAVKANDAAKLREVSHSLKGACGTIGAARVRAVSAILEAYAKGLKVEESPDDLLKRLQSAIDEAYGALEKYLA